MKTLSNTTPKMLKLNQHYQLKIKNISFNLDDLVKYLSLFSLLFLYLTQYIVNYFCCNYFNNLLFNTTILY
jgi:hypothetical protein